MTDTHLDEDNAIDRIHRYCTFGDDRAYILWIVARRKHNDSITNSSEVIHRRVLTDPEDVEPNVRDLYAITARHPYTFRLYLTVNARDTTTALLAFQQELTDTIGAFLTGDEGQQSRAQQLDSEWKSVLHQPRSTAETRFHFDLDDLSYQECVDFTRSLPDGVYIHTTVETPNGYHVITDPFDYTGWETPIEYDELDTDGQLFVSVIEGSEQ